MATDLREEVLLFLDFMSKYAHLDLQLLTLRQLLAQFEKETDALLEKRDRRLFRDLTLAFVARRRVGASAAPASKPTAAAKKAQNASTVPRVSAPSPKAAAPAEFATPTKAPVRFLALGAAGTGASPAGSDCSQVSLDGIAGLVRQSGARILPQQPPPGQQAVYTTTNSIIRVPSGFSGAQNQVIHLSVQRIAPLAARPTTAAASPTLATAATAAAAALPTPTKLLRLSEDSNSRPAVAAEAQAQAQASMAALSFRFSDLLRVLTRSGLQYPRSEIFSAPDLPAKVAALEQWLLGHGLPRPLTVEGARQFALSRQLGAAASPAGVGAPPVAGDDVS